MIEVAAARINSFARVASHVDVPPIEEPIFIITASQLEAIVTQAIERATMPILESRIEDLERKVGAGEGRGDAPDSHKWQDNLLHIVQLLQAENVALNAKLEAFQEYSARERAFDRQRIAKLEHKEPQPLQKDRGEILRALIAANGGKMLAKEGRKKMHLSESRFSELLTTMKGEIEVKPFHIKMNQNVLILI
jgi:uncharacterized membrane protein